MGVLSQKEQSFLSFVLFCSSVPMNIYFLKRKKNCGKQKFLEQKAKFKKCVMKTQKYKILRLDFYIRGKRRLIQLIINHKKCIIHYLTPRIPSVPHCALFFTQLVYLDFSAFFTSNQRAHHIKPIYIFDQRDLTVDFSQ